MSHSLNRSTSRESWLQSESAGGLILMACAALSIIVANSPLAYWYNLFLEIPVEIRIGALDIDKPLLLWINDGLMAVFFFLVGLELKRELLEGELSKPGNIALPAFGAVGGMLVPALVYTYFNWGDPFAMQGWAIPAATDIAFALAVLSLLGPRVPLSIKLFLTSLAIFDDVGAVMIIAIFYTDSISFVALAVVALCLPLLALLNYRGVTRVGFYMALGAVMWVATLKSGVHATLAGVVLAMFIPLKNAVDSDYSPLRALEHGLHGFVGFVVLPVFAFANAGLSLKGVGVDQLLHPVPLGIAAGLFIGKQLGVFGFCWLAIKLGWAKLPDSVNWGMLYGTASLCGIGFTMSLFIGSLAFDVPAEGPMQIFDERLGIIIGSLLAGVVGHFILRRSLPRKSALIKATN
ncbi:Na+/H+ antiporter NhaA [Porticoccaceae bacterium]|nr:Na+/H+ antiporter NhaA [Porticoccaceae bacterium]